jgi:hypothetical protein
MLTGTGMTTVIDHSLPVLVIVKNETQDVWLIFYRTFTGGNAEKISKKYETEMKNFMHTGTVPVPVG